MSDLRVAWAPTGLVIAEGGMFPARHVWCVGRNYAEHAREMGADPQRQDPLFFSKPASALTNESQVRYPADTGSLHHEAELVVLLAGGGRDLASEECEAIIFGFAVGVDLTRRDVQARAKQAGHPWEMSKGFDQSAPVGSIASAGDWQPHADALIELSVNGQVRQSGRLGEMIWPVPQLLSRLSHQVTLYPGDVIFTGTPAGVGELQPGDEVRVGIENLPELRFEMGGGPAGQKKGGVVHPRKRD